jgi:hypothetical protein
MKGDYLKIKKAHQFRRWGVDEEALEKLNYLGNNFIIFFKSPSNLIFNPNN